MDTVRSTGEFLAAFLHALCWNSWFSMENSNRNMRKSKAAKVAAQKSFKMFLGPRNQSRINDFSTGMVRKFRDNSIPSWSCHECAIISPIDGPGVPQVSRTTWQQHFLGCAPRYAGHRRFPSGNPSCEIWGHSRWRHRKSGFDHGKWWKIRI